ncbi:ferredoxin [Sorangium sp. So ce1024]|uniref:ferredoxin n=1 Tax=unclassified Sorangium TaxID=2621164 RepID=UPI003F0E7DFF
MEASSKLTVIVDHEKCCGAGQCVMVAPKVFDQRDDGIVILLDAEPPAEQHAAVREAVAVCPGAAIRLSESA